VIQAELETANTELRQALRREEAQLEGLKKLKKAEEVRKTASTKFEVNFTFGSYLRFTERKNRRQRKIKRKGQSEHKRIGFDPFNLPTFAPQEYAFFSSFPFFFFVYRI
jgi:hypothetical protein